MSGDKNLSCFKSDGITRGAMVSYALCKEVVLSFLAKLVVSGSAWMPEKLEIQSPVNGSGTNMILLLKSMPCFEKVPFLFCPVLRRYGRTEYSKMIVITDSSFANHSVCHKLSGALRACLDSQVSIILMRCRKLKHVEGVRYGRI